MWIEMRCDKRTETSAEGQAGLRCYSHDNEGPMGECSDNRKSIASLVRDLEEEGRNTGWKKIKGDWVCPFCLKLSKPAGSEQV